MNDIRIVDYTAKAFVLVGDTSNYVQELKDLSGRWISVRFGGKAWMFSKKRLKEVASLLGLPPEMESDEGLS